MKRVCVIGGGTGSYTVLTGLKNYDLDISAIVAMSDDGGSSGKLRDEFGILPPGDVRKCITALSESSDIMRNLFQYRFEKGSVQGHAMGNLLITALREITGSDYSAIKAACRIFSVNGSVIPVTLDTVKLCAELEDGQIIYGESNIDFPQHDGSLKIRRLFFDNKAEANQDAISALANADLIVIGPGDLYGSIISNFLVEGICNAIINSKAKKVYVCNVMTKYGETLGFNTADFYNTIVSYLGRDCIDYFIINNARINNDLLQNYLLESSEPVSIEPIEINAKSIECDIASQTSIVRHDPKKLAAVIVSLLGQ